MKSTRRWLGAMAAATGIFLAGCVSSSQYADPQATGRVPREAQSCGVGCVSNGARLTLGGEWHQPGSFIVVAGNELILEQTVLPGDKVWVEIDHPLLGNCQVAVKVNGAVAETADTNLQVYRAYFVAATTGS